MLYPGILVVRPDYHKVLLDKQQAIAFDPNGNFCTDRHHQGRTRTVGSLFLRAKVLLGEETRKTASRRGGEKQLNSMLAHTECESHPISE